jgi:hypothetical protein
LPILPHDAKIHAFHGPLAVGKTPGADAMRLCFSFALVVCAAPITASLCADEPKLPLLVSEDFEKGADRWQPTDPAAWKVKETQSGKVLSQFDKKSKYKPPYRSPFHFALLKDVTVGDFVLDVKALSTHADYGHRDMCVVFGYQDPAHFYYVHFGKETDDNANQIFIVDGKPRTKISTKTTSGTNWTDRWHAIRVARNATDGSIEVFFDDMKTPVMTAKNDRFKWGQIGVGSFDDTGDWDDVKLYGTKVDRKAK